MKFCLGGKVLILIFLLCPMMASAEVKIGFVNMIEIMEKSPQAEAARSALEKEFSDRDKKLTKARDEILKLDETLAKDTAILSDSRRTELEKQISTKKRRYSDQQDELRKDFNVRRDQELNKLQKDVHEIVIKVAKAEGYDLVVTQPVLFVSDRIDMTELILQALQRAR